MILISLRSQIRRVAKMWSDQYPNAEGDKLRILTRLKSIDAENATPLDIEKIIGNRSWVRPRQCAECCKYHNMVACVGGNDSIDSCEIYLCRKCLLDAVKLIDAGDLPPAGSP